MIKYFLNITLLSVCFLTVSVNPIESKCIDRFDGKVVTAAGSWSTPVWNEKNPLGQMTFDKVNCMYYIILSDLKIGTIYLWKVNGNF